MRSKRSNRLDRIRTRGWVRVGEVAAAGVAANDAVVGDFVADILHSDGVVAVAALGGVRDVGSWGEGAVSMDCEREVMSGGTGEERADRREWALPSRGLLQERRR